MFKCALRVVAILAVVAPAALGQAKINLDSQKVTYLVPTGIFVPQGETITINATGTLTLTDPDGAGSFTVNAIGVIQTAPDENLDQDFYDFLTDEALPQLQPPSPGKIKFPPGDTNAILVGAYGALVLGLSSNQCGASSAADFPHGFINPGTGAGPLPISGGYIYLGVQRDDEVVVSGTYAVTISLSGQPNPALGCTTPLETLDPYPGFLAPNAPHTFGLTINQAALTAGGVAVSGVSADGVSQVLIRGHVPNPNHQYVVALLDENNSIAPANLEDGQLVSLSGGLVTSGSAVIPAVQQLNGDNYVFVAYRTPVDYARASGADGATASRNIGIVLFDNTTATLVTGTQLALLRPPVLFVHGLWGDPSTWDQFSASLKGSINGLRTYVASYAQHNGDGVVYNTTGVLIQAYHKLEAFKAGDNPTGKAVAAAQLDFIVHSMGGLISNTLPSFAGFRTMEDYGQGLIHKLITVDTPYQGSPLAFYLGKAPSSCQNMLIYFGNPIGGAIRDLTPGSVFLQNFSIPQNLYYSHAISSFVTPDQATSAGGLIDGLVNKTADLSETADACSMVFQTNTTAPGNFSFPAYFMTPGDIYNGASDLIVSELSQLGPANQAYVPGKTAHLTGGLAHSNGSRTILGIRFGIPGSLNSDAGNPQPNPDTAFQLLNASVNSTDRNSFVH